MTNLPPPPEAPLPPPPDAPPPPPADSGGSKFGRWKDKATELAGKANDVRLERAAKKVDETEPTVGGPIAEFTQSRFSNTISPERVLLFEDRVEHVAKEMTSSSSSTISFDQPIQVRVETGLRHGTLIVEAAGGTITLEKMPKDDAEAAKRQILEASNRWRTLMRTTTTVTAPAAPPPVDSGVDVTAKLTELASLHQAGALTDDEFAAAKARLLG